MLRYVLFGLLVVLLLAQGFGWLYVIEQQGFRVDALSNPKTGRYDSYAHSAAKSTLYTYMWGAAGTTLACFGGIYLAHRLTRKS